jgi:outer membrane murein-binding lipoprotein Lpp
MSWESGSQVKGSSTTAKTALGLSIGALGVELLGLGGGGLLAGRLGMPESAAVTPQILSAVMAVLPSLGGGCNRSRVAELEAEVANLNAKLYTNEVGVNTFKESQIALDKVASNFKDVFDELVNIRVANARTEEQLKCIQKETDYKIDALRAETKLGFTNLGNALECEIKERKADVQATRDWTECNFVKYKKVIDSTQLCPPVTTTAGA